MELNGVMSMLPLATAGKVMVLYLSFFLYMRVYVCVCVLSCHDEAHVYIAFFHLSLFKTYPHMFPDRKSDSNVCCVVDMVMYM